MRVLDAANLVDKSYHNLDQLPIKHRYNKNGVQAYVLTDRTLVIPGTNDGLLDWDKNMGTAAVQLKFSDFPTAPALENSWWHQGFLEFAKEIYDFALPLGIARIVGHSLGGAGAQVLGPVLRKPVISFGSPTPKWGSAALSGEHRTLNLALKLDKVPRLLWFTRFRQTGHRHTLALAPRAFPNHKMKYYIEALSTGGTNVSIPRTWG
jgi:hypothetical protein